MVVSEGAINNIMGGMENTAGVRLHSHRHKLKQRFDIIRKLGQGTYGKVQLAVNKETGQEVAIKTIKKAKIETEQDLIRIRREIQIMSSVQHPQIIHIYEVFENREKMVLVMEYAAGGELYDYLSDRKVLTEDEARRIFRHVASATYYCHKHKICHRDLKLENILLDLDGNAKIADFGLSNVFDEKHRLDTFCGSPLYASPEIVKGIPYTGPEVDCWSLGVLLYTLVYGAMPFDGSNFKRLVKQITQGDYYEPKKPSRASDLIRQMLTVSATKRATIEDICSHWWVNEGFLEPCLEVAEALANQTPVRLDLLLSLAPKHINSEHMLIQPEEDDSARSPPTSEVTRPPPQLLLPPPPPPDALPVPTARSASLGAVTSINHNEIEALLARKIQEKKEEEKKRKANESGVIEKKKKRDSTIEGTPKPSRKERKADVNSVTGEPGSNRRPPAGPDSEISDRKKSVKKREPLLDGDSTERDKSERSERKKSVKKREPVSDGDVSQLSEKSERRKSVKKRESYVDKDSENDKVERKKSVKKREPSVDKELSESERIEKKKTVKKRESSIPRESLDDKVERRKSTIKKEPTKEKLSSTTDSEPVIKPLSVINGESYQYENVEMGKSRNLHMDTSEDQLLDRSLKPPLPKDQDKEQVQPSASDMELNRSDSAKTEAIENLEQLSEPMEVEPVTPIVTASSPSLAPSSISASMRSVASSGSADGTLKASDSSLSRESVSPLKNDTGAPPLLQDTPKNSSSPSQTPKVSDARKAFEAKPADKPKVNLRKKPTTESLPSSPTRKESPKLPTTLSGPITSQDVIQDATPTKDTSSSKLNRDKSPVKEMSPEKHELKEKSITRETEKEKSPKIDEATNEEMAKPTLSRPSITKAQDQEVESDILPSIDTTEKVHEETEKEKLDEVKGARIEKPHADTSEKLITPKMPTHAMEVDPHETITSSEEEEAIVVGGLNLKLGGVGKISEVGTKQEVRKAEVSDSSDSESEAEKLLKMVSEKREKVEAARQEKLRKVSEAKDKELKKDMPAIREEPQSPSKSPSKSPEKAIKSSPSETRESAPEQKFATLPRGFKAKTPRATAATTTPSPMPAAEKLRKEDTKDKAISQEIEGMMSAIKAVDQAITKGPSETTQKSQEAQAADRKKTQLEIVLDNKKSDAQEPDPANKRASYAEIKLTSPTAKDAPKTQEYKSEVRHNVGPVHGMGEAQLQRAKRERIIPIMLEDDDDDEELTTSEGHPHSDRSVHVDTSSSAGSRVTSPLPFQLPHRRTSDPRSPMYKPSPEPIRKSPRERIIPIAVEGEGVVVVPPHAEGAAVGVAGGGGLGPLRARRPFSRATLSGRPASLSRGRGGGAGFLSDRSESFSSAGEEEEEEEDEEEEDDGFQILTAESLFSTLLNRVRSLTRKMNSADEGRGGGGERSRRPSSSSSSRPPPEPNGAPHSAASSGFWSSLYGSPRDSPSRRISETMSRSSLGRDDDTLGGLTSPLWTRSVSRDTSDADTLFSEASTPFGTLPRGWRASRWSAGEDGGESDTSEASARSMGRRPQQYSRGPSRELHNIPDEEMGTMGGTAYPGSGMSLPRPYPASGGGNLSLNRGMHDSADRIAAMYGTLRGPHRRPHSTVGGPPGECIGRDGGLYEQQLQQRPATPNAAAQMSMQKETHASQPSPGSQTQQQSEETTEALKQSVQEQLQQLVRELEAGDDQAPEVATLPEQQQTDDNTPRYDRFSVPHGSPVQFSGIQKPSSSTQIHSPMTLQHSSSKSMYSSNPALHTSCKPNTQTHSDSTLLNSGYQGIPKMTKNTKGENEATRIKRNTSLVKDKQSENNANLNNTALNGRENGSSCERASSMVKNTLASSTTSPSNVPLLHNDINACDQKDHAVSVTSSPNSDDGEAGDGSRQATTPREQRLRSNNKVIIRSADRSALEAYRRSRGRSDVHEYQRGKSEDLCHALNSLSRMESSQHKGAPVRSLFNSQNLPDINYKVTSPNTGKNEKQNHVVATGSNNNYNHKIINNSNNKNTNDRVSKSNINGSVPNSANLAKGHNDLTVNTIPRVGSGSTNNNKNNNGGITTSRSTTGIPLKSNSRSTISTRSSYSGITNSNTYTKGNSELPQVKTYQRNKSRELTPAIEAASEKFSQLNSGTLKRISPFEAYRRTKTSELPMDAANSESMRVRLKSPPPAPDRTKSPFEKAKTTIEKKFEYTKSPLVERATSQRSEGANCAPLTSNLNQLATKDKKGENAKIKPVAQEDNSGIEHNNYKHKNVENEMDDEKQHEKERGCEKDREKEKGKDSDKERGKVKKTSSCDPEKPKSMYKLLASKFNRSGSNVSDNNRSAADKRCEEDDANEKEDKFRLKRPSRFLKHKTEKSSSKSSVCDVEGVQYDSERPERKPSKKLTDALNKFLGRKDTKGEDSRSSVNSMSQPSVPTIGIDEEQPKKPPRVKPKKFSKSQENLYLSRVAEGGGTEAQCTTERAQSVVPNSCSTNLQPSYTLESVTKSICDHLSQLESDITSRIGNIGVQESGAGVRPTGGSQVVPTGSSVSPITTYGLSPALAHRRSARPTNLDLAGANIDNHHPLKTHTSRSTAATNVSTNHIPKTENERVKYAQIKRLDGAGDADPSDGSHTLTESGESATGLEDMRGLSENEDESVMDRITRKSYYSKFQNKKKPQQLRRANTKEDVDQQLAAAKARLMKEDTQRAVRESLSPLRYTSIVSPRASVTSPPWEIPRRHSRKSLPPEEDPNDTFLFLGRRGTSLQPDDVLNVRRLTSVQPEDIQTVHRLPSLPTENCHYTQRAPSVPLEGYSSSCRTKKSIPPEGHPYAHRAPSMPPDSFSTKCHSNSIPCNSSKTNSVSPATDNELGEGRAKDAAAAVAAAGARAGEAAAAVAAAADGTSERGSSVSREPSVNRVLRPEHAPDDTRSLAREELSRRLTHLTRISGTSGLSGWSRGGLAGGSNTGNTGEKRSYRRTNTTGHVGDQQLSGPTPSSNSPGLGERPVYRRTNTMDLPPSDARARPGSEYRRQLQDPARRYSATSLGRGGDKGRFLLQEPLVEGEILNTSSSRLPSAHLTTPPLSSSSSYHRGYSTMDPPRYTSTLSSTISPLPRRTSFYRY